MTPLWPGSAHTQRCPDSKRGWVRGPKVEPVPPSWPEVLGRAAEKYANDSFWTNF